MRSTISASGGSSTAWPAIERTRNASLKAWDDTRKNPDEAIDVFRQSAPEKSREIARAALMGTLPLLDSEGTRGRPLGFQSEPDWDSTLQAIALTGLTSLPRADQVFTNEFIPAR